MNRFVLVGFKNDLKTCLTVVKNTKTKNQKKKCRYYTECIEGLVQNYCNYLIFYKELQ